MPIGLWAFVGWMLFVVLTGALLLFWGWRSGQFADVEDAKYEMLKDREPEAWPPRKEDAR